MSAHNNLAAANRPSSAAASVVNSPGENAARGEVTLCPFKKGDIVDLSLWDRYERPDKKMGRSVVIGSHQRHWCHSGWMIWVKSLEHPHLAERDLDSQWMKLSP